MVLAVLNQLLNDLNDKHCMGYCILDHICNPLNAFTLSNFLNKANFRNYIGIRLIFEKVKKDTFLCNF